MMQKIYFLVKFVSREKQCSAARMDIGLQRMPSNAQIG
jgi:hypothetical protein